MKKTFLGPDNREYLRLESAFPIEFTIVRLQGDLPGINWLNGCTRNVSKGGICLETDKLDEHTSKFISDENVFLELKLFVPPTQPPMKAVTEILWHKKMSDNKMMLGLKFRTVAKTDINRLMKHAKWFQISAKAIVAASIITVMIVIFANYMLLNQQQELEQNKSFVQHLNAPPTE